MKKNVIPVLLLLLLPMLSAAQSFMGWEYNDRYFSVQVGTGRSGYIGELTNGKPLVGGLSMFNVGVEARLLGQLGAKFQYINFDLAGSDENAKDSTVNQQRNLSFFSNNHEFSLQAVYYIFPYTGKYHTRRVYEPYIAVGVAYTLFNPKANLDGTDYVLSDFQTEGKAYGKSGIVLPLSLGVKWKLNEFMNLNLDLAWRFTFTDYLDDVSGVYGGPFTDGSLKSRLSNRKDEIAIVNQNAYDSLVPGAQRGNAANKDKYFFVNFSLEIYLPQDLFKGRGGSTKKEKIIGKPSAY